MNYLLQVRSFIDVKIKEKAQKQADRIFDGLNPLVKGRYYKNEEWWEIEAKKKIKYTNEKEALFETMAYFSNIERDWLINGPYEEGIEILVSGIYDDRSNHVHKWCHYELIRL